MWYGGRACDVVEDGMWWKMGSTGMGQVGVVVLLG